MFQRAWQRYPWTRNELIGIPETANFAGTNTVSNLIVVTFSKYDIPSTSEGSPREYLDWSKLDSPKIFKQLENCCAFCPLDDVSLPLTPLLSGFVTYLRLCRRFDDGDLGGGCGATTSAMAKSFAMAFRTLEEAGKESTLRVGPLPAALFSAATLAEQTSASP